MTVATPVPKTVVVLGAAYGGHRAVQYLVTNLPDDWRIVVIERSTHFNREFFRVTVVVQLVPLSSPNLPSPPTQTSTPSLASLSSKTSNTRRSYRTPTSSNHHRRSPPLLHARTSSSTAP
jgi:hypothetical protein